MEFVTFAATGGSPVTSREGNVMSEPPPATALTAPARKPAPSSRTTSAVSMEWLDYGVAL
jgi:hypothetical protein